MQATFDGSGRKLVWSAERFGEWKQRTSASAASARNARTGNHSPFAKRITAWGLTPTMCLGINSGVTGAWTGTL